MRPLAPALLLALAACQTEVYEQGDMGTWERRGAGARKDAEPEPERRGAEPEEPAQGGDEVVSIPAEPAAELRAFADRSATMVADVVEIDASSLYWLASMSITVSRDAVTRTDREDPAAGVFTVVLVRNPGVAVTPESMPTVRFGGLRFVGADKVVVRFGTRPSADRPIWLRAVGAGERAVFRVDGDPPREWRGRRVDVASEVARRDGTYRFESGVEASP